jgi:hypothetical protein
VTASIIANSGSYAESYAVENGITCSTGKTSSSSKDSGSDSKGTTKKKTTTTTSGTTSTSVGRVTSLRVTSPKKKTIQVTWKKVSDATGYQIQYARNAKFTKELNLITIRKNTNSRKIVKLAKGKKYYVMIRAYKTVRGKTYYSSWSKKTSVKCK